MRKYMTYRFFHSIALGFRPVLVFLALTLSMCKCSEKCNAFWPCEMVPHIEIREPEMYEPVIKGS